MRECEENIKTEFQHTYEKLEELNSAIEENGEKLSSKIGALDKNILDNYYKDNRDELMKADSYYDLYKRSRTEQKTHNYIEIVLGGGVALGNSLWPNGWEKLMDMLADGDGLKQNIYQNKDANRAYCSLDWFNLFSYELVTATMHISRAHFLNDDQLTKNDLEHLKLGLQNHKDSYVRACPPGVILIQSEGEAAEWVGDHLGYFTLLGDELNSRPAYKQRGGDIAMGGRRAANIFLYYVKAPHHTVGRWFVSRELGNWKRKSSIFLRAISNAILPPKSSWQYSKDGSWTKDPSIELVHPPVEDDSCSNVTVSSSGPAGRAQPDHMGKFRWTGDWQRGRKLYTNGKTFLRISVITGSWRIGREKNTRIVNSSTVPDAIDAGGRGTTCPCNTKAGVSVRFDRKWWQYYAGAAFSGDWSQEQSINVKC